MLTIEWIDGIPVADHCEEPTLTDANVVLGRIDPDRFRDDNRRDGGPRPQEPAPAPPNRSGASR